MSAFGGQTDIVKRTNGKCPADLTRDAMAAWRRTVCCVRSLLADQAVPLWQAALAEAASMARYIKGRPDVHRQRAALTTAPPLGPQVTAVRGPNAPGVY
jgi:hypothetical protein